MWVCKKFIFLFVILSLLIQPSYAQQIRVGSVRYLSEGKQSKIVLDVSNCPKHRVYVLENPSRLVIDVYDAQVSPRLSQPSPSHPLFAHIRTAEKNTSDSRIVVDLKQEVTGKSHKLATHNTNKQQLIVDLTSKSQATIAAKEKRQDKLAKSRLDETDRQGGKTLTTASSTSKHKADKQQRFPVGIDAGHGRDAPGARGPSGTLEKQVTLAIAKKVQALINGQAGMKAKLVRKGDYYVGLRERMKIARQAGADLFISIHADAVENPDVRGASVYTLSRTGASNEAARWLANSENAKEKVGGVNLEDKDEMVATVLLDLSQTAAQQASENLANKVLKNFHSIGDLHYNHVQQAGFVVLKSPDIPSILVETAYISNPSDELNLRSDRYQNKMAHAIFKGVVNYYEQMQPSEINRIAKL